MLSTRHTYIAVAVFAGIVAGAMCVRLLHGLDLMDEPFCIAMGLRFALGDRPLVDEKNLAQGAALLFTPLVWLYLKVRGGTDGIVLFMRGAYFAMSLATALLLARTFARRVTGALPWLAGVVFFSYVPVRIPTLSYNTIGCQGFAVGALLLFAAAGRRPWLIVAAGALHGLAAVAYPPLLGAVAFVTGWIAYQSAQARARRAAGYALGAATPLLVVALAYRIGPSAVRDLLAVLKQNGAGESHGYHKLVSLGRHLFGWPLVRPIAWTLLTTAVARRVCPRRPSLAVACALMAGLGLIFFNRASLGGDTETGLVLALALVAPFHTLWGSPNDRLRDLMRWIWVPSMGAGLVMGWASDNETFAMANALLPCALVMLIAFGERVREACGRATPAVVLAVVVVCAIHFFQSSAYDDGPMRALRARMRSGPFRGLFTTPEKRDWVEAFDARLGAQAPEAARLLVIPAPSSAYLATMRRPATFSTWTACGLLSGERCRDYYRPRAWDDTLVVLVYRFPLRGKLADISAETRALRPLTDARCRRIEAAPDYELLRCAR